MFDTMFGAIKIILTCTQEAPKKKEREKKNKNTSTKVAATIARTTMGITRRAIIKLIIITTIITCVRTQQIIIIPLAVFVVAESFLIRVPPKKYAT